MARPYHSMRDIYGAGVAPSTRETTIADAPGARPDPGAPEMRSLAFGVAALLGALALLTWAGR